MPAGDIEIYGLCDPVTGRVRYVGKANCAASRLRSHLRDSKRRDTPVYRWIRELNETGLSPTLTILATVSIEEWAMRERALISEYRALGPLLNVANGGNEPFCSPDVRAINGRKNARARDARIWRAKRDLGALLAAGYVSEKTKEKMRARPDLFGEFASFL